MAPNPCTVDTAAAKLPQSKASTVLNLANLRKAIPEHAFKKSLAKSIYYMVRDALLWGTSLYSMYFFVHSNVYESLPLWQKAIATFVFWNFTGFFMWCMFMIGHDCGHSNFSDYEYINDIFGHIAHGALLVPYHPWQLSHRRHHMYHNHESKDYSHPWYTPERLQRPDEGMARLMHKQSWLRFLFPFYGWHIYLYGLPDGSHYFPFTNQRLWKESTPEEKTKCYLSTAVVAVALSMIYYICSGDIQSMLFYYFGPYVFFGWWLVTVTYLQHHDHDTLVYGDADWKFVISAFETVDRTFGYGIDHIHHNITDGHVAHHLFFTKIPHYNLPVATKAIRQYLKENDLEYMYKHYDCRDFVFRVHKYFVDFGFKAHKATSSEERILKRTK